MHEAAFRALPHCGERAQSRRKRAEAGGQPFHRRGFAPLYALTGIHSRYIRGKKTITNPLRWSEGQQSCTLETARESMHCRLFGLCSLSGHSTLQRICQSHHSSSNSVACPRCMMNAAPGGPPCAPSLFLDLLPAQDYHTLSGVNICPPLSGRIVAHSP